MITRELFIEDVGVERFNNDHQRLLFYVIEFERLAGRFQERAPFEDEWDQVDSLFPRLDKYTREHFAAEENLMRQHGYACLAEHVGQHQELIRHLRQLEIDVAARRAEAIIHLESFLLNWLQNHINQEDRKYRGCFAWAETRAITEKALFNEMIAAQHLHRALELGGCGMVLLDLRTDIEQNDGIIRGSRLLRCDHNLADRQDTEPFRRSFLARFDPGQFDAEALHVLICRSGPRAAIALEYFQENDLKACELIGGIQEWTRQGHPLVAPEELGESFLWD
ncbi:MAG: hemerythrin domain-containing protein [Magnetococcales bacterium]|nr:hemerythrin domain-containing protein [Magnetococcales bacterium]